MKHFILLLSLLAGGSACYADSSSHHDADGAASRDHEEHASTVISDAMAQTVGITTAQTGPQLLHQTMSSYGRLTTAPEQTSHIRARFSGVIKSVQVNIGDVVKNNDLLAVIESNESFKHYELRAPITGTVVQRHASVGEMTQEQVLFSILNFDSLWAELQVFPSQQQGLDAGGKVFIQLENQQIETTVAHFLPTNDGVPHLLARAKIDNVDNKLLPGAIVEGRIVIAEFDAAIAVKNIALQNLGGQTGVFIKHDEQYTFKPLVLGRADHQFTEVIAGIEANIDYVVDNSFLIKADIEKSSAEHQH
ncbi:MAG: HlyD family efflux transporter periplasmic adaptor subunit [Spongiibacteraceae bacterium]